MRPARRGALRQRAQADAPRRRVRGARGPRPARPCSTSSRHAPSATTRRAGGDRGRGPRRGADHDHPQRQGPRVRRRRGPPPLARPAAGFAHPDLSSGALGPRETERRAVRDAAAPARRPRDRPLRAASSSARRPGSARPRRSCGSSYVAATRAQERLILSGSAGSPPTRPPESLRGSHTALQLLLPALHARGWSGEDGDVADSAAPGWWRRGGRSGARRSGSASSAPSPERAAELRPEASPPQAPGPPRRGPASPGAGAPPPRPAPGISPTRRWRDMRTAGIASTPSGSSDSLAPRLVRHRRRAEHSGRTRGRRAPGPGARPTRALARGRQRRARTPGGRRPASWDAVQSAELERVVAREGLAGDRDADERVASLVETGSGLGVRSELASSRAGRGRRSRSSSSSAARSSAERSTCWPTPGGPARRRLQDGRGRRRRPGRAGEPVRDAARPLRPGGAPGERPIGSGARRVLLSGGAGSDRSRALRRGRHPRGARAAGGVDPADPRGRLRAHGLSPPIVVPRLSRGGAPVRRARVEAAVGDVSERIALFAYGSLDQRRERRADARAAGRGRGACPAHRLAAALVPSPRQPRDREDLRGRRDRCRAAPLRRTEPRARPRGGRAERAPARGHGAGARAACASRDPIRPDRRGGAAGEAAAAFDRVVTFTAKPENFAPTLPPGAVILAAVS